MSYILRASKATAAPVENLPATAACPKCGSFRRQSLFHAGGMDGVVCLMCGKTLAFLWREGGTKKVVKPAARLRRKVGRPKKQPDVPVAASNGEKGLTQ